MKKKNETMSPKEIHPTNQEIKRQLEILKANLPDNYAIYHERVTVLIQLTQFDILDTRVNFKGRVVKPLNKEHPMTRRFFQYFRDKGEFAFGAIYLFPPNNMPILNETILSRPYCPFMLWLDPDLIQFVRDHDDEVTRHIPRYIFSGEDWTVLKKYTNT